VNLVFCLYILFYFFELPNNPQPTIAQRVLPLKNSHTQPAAALFKTVVRGPW